MTEFTHPPSVALTALKHWLPAWPINRDHDFQNVIKVDGWQWVYRKSLRGDSWEFQKFTKGGILFITQNAWRTTLTPLERGGVLV